MVKRRLGTRPARTSWTPAGIALIEDFQARNRIPSFSAAAETLVRMGLERSPGEIIEPMLVSTIRREVHRHLERLIRLQIHTAIDAGMAWRFAAAGARDVMRLKQNPPERYQEFKALAIKEARQSLSHASLKAVVDELYAALAEQEQPTTLAEALGLDAQERSDEEAASLPPIHPGDSSR